MKISSQRYVNEHVVSEKVAAEDYVVTLAEIEGPDGEEYEIVIDGHHSLAAAKEAGVDPEYEYSDYNYQSEVECIGFDSFLESHYIDSDWYDIETGRRVW